MTLNRASALAPPPGTRVVLLGPRRRALSGPRSIRTSAATSRRRFSIDLSLLLPVSFCASWPQRHGRQCWEPSSLQPSSPAPRFLSTLCLYPCPPVSLLLVIIIDGRLSSSLARSLPFCLPSWPSAPPDLAEAGPCRPALRTLHDDRSPLSLASGCSQNQRALT